MTDTPTPPALAGRLLKWVGKSAYVDDLLGDAEELFYEDLNHYPPWRCKVRYWRQIISLVFSYALVSRRRNNSFAITSNYNNTPAMFLNYFKVAYRNLLKNKFFTSINVIALSVGMSISLLLLAVIADINEYDQFHTQRDQTYRLITRINYPDEPQDYASSSVLLTDFLENQSGVSQITPLDASLRGEVTQNKKSIPMSGFFVPPNFFRLFDFKLLHGDPDKVLSNPNSLLLTESEARKLFSEKEAMGQVVQIEPFGEFIVTGILEDHPAKSHLHFDMLASYAHPSPVRLSNQVSQTNEAWRNIDDHYTYFRITDDKIIPQLESALNAYVSQMNEKTNDVEQTVTVQAMEDITFGKDLRDSPGPQWDLLSLIVFGSLALLILVPACFNYANLSIARALTRAKEIGIRKVAGGLRKHIFFQFITESMVLFFIAFILAYTMFLFLRTEFLAILAPASRAGLTLTFSLSMAIIFMGFMLFTGFLIGLVPAIYFSRLQTLNALKSKIRGGRRAAFNFRNVMLTGQFVLSLGFTIAVGIIISQYNYSMNYSMGFTQENIVNIPLEGNSPDQLRETFDSLSFVESVSFSGGIIGTPSGYTSWTKLTEGDDSTRAQGFLADRSFISSHDFKLVAGRNFSENPGFAERELIVNEAYCKEAGIENPYDILNQSIVMDDGEPYRIVGVAHDFNYRELREPIRPFYFRYSPEQMAYMNIKVSNAGNPYVIARIKELWSEVTEEPFTSAVLQEQIEEAYDWYFYMVKVIAFLGLLAVSISCLGLLGMVVFNVNQRAKEVGIRKVHGASTPKIVLLLSKEYLIIFLIACCIGIPATTFFFSTVMPVIQYYSEQVTWLPVALGTLILFLIAAGTIGSQTVKAALANPAETLKCE